jgi:hypothetical protein
MSPGTLVFFIGLSIIILPSLGIPGDWKVYASWALGGLLVFVGYLIRRSQYLQRLEKDGLRSDDTFVETTAPLFGDTTVQ